MNSRNEWTAFRETMSFYGVAHDRLPRVVADRETAVRATVSTSFVSGEADRRIGVWCVAPVTIPARRKPELETLAQSRTASAQVSSQTPVQMHFGSHRSVEQRRFAHPRRESQKSQKIIGAMNVRSLDIRGHIGVSSTRAMQGLQLPQESSTCALSGCRAATLGHTLPNAYAFRSS